MVIGVMWYFYFECFEELTHCFPQWQCHFTFRPPVHKGSHFSTSPPTLLIFCFSHNSPPNGCEVVAGVFESEWDRSQTDIKVFPPLIYKVLRESSGGPWWLRETLVRRKLWNRSCADEFSEANGAEHTRRTTELERTWRHVMQERV